MKNKGLSRYMVKKIIFCFCTELTATQTSKLLGINRNTVNVYYHQIRIKIFAYQEKMRQNFIGEIELDESYFGGKHKGVVGRSVKKKIPVFGILKRNDKVYTQIIPDVSSRTLKHIIKSIVKTKSVVFTDSWSSYDGLVLDGYEHHRVNHKTEFVKTKRNHINGIESFWSYAKNKLHKFYGIKKEYFHLYVKEMEFRFNNRCGNMEKLLNSIYFGKSF